MLIFNIHRYTFTLIHTALHIHTHSLAHIDKLIHTHFHTLTFTHFCTYTDTGWPGSDTPGLNTLSPNKTVRDPGTAGSCLPSLALHDS